MDGHRCSLLGQTPMPTPEGSMEKYATIAAKIWTLCNNNVLSNQHTENVCKLVPIAFNQSTISMENRLPYARRVYYLGLGYNSKATRTYHDMLFKIKCSIPIKIILLYGSTGTLQDETMP